MRQGAAAGGPDPTGWGPGEGTTLRGALPRGLGLSLKKVQTKEHHGAACLWCFALDRTELAPGQLDPWTPGGAKVLACARRVLGPVGEGAIVGL